MSIPCLNGPITVKGRPKKASDDHQGWDVRITPSDQQEITFDPKEEDFKVFVACKEGGDENLRLHYHIYCSSNRSETYLAKLFNQWGKATTKIKGNAIFSKRKAHEGTIGYCVKGGNVVCRLGWTDMFLEEMLTKSADYRKNNETKRKTALRAKENFLATILKEVAEELKLDPSPTPPKIVDMILRRYDKINIRFPNRNTLETAVMSLMFKYEPTTVMEWYSKNLVSRYEYN